MKLGIIGTGRIAGRFVEEARTVEGVELYAVCNPNLESAERFVEEHNIPYYTANVEEFIGEVEAVYIATPHQTHYAYAKQMLRAGIHVLCEKPMVFEGTQARELFDLAAANKCVLMEAVKTAYCPGFQKILEVVRSGKIGEIRDVEACFSRLTPTNLREMTDVQCGGSFTELATYSMLPIVKLLGTEHKDVHFHTVCGANGVDTYTKAYVDYGTATGLIKAGLGVKSEGQLVIAGTKGYILAESPWWLTKKFEVRYEDPNKREVYTADFEGSGLRYEIQAFLRRIEECKEEVLLACASQAATEGRPAGEGHYNEGLMSNESIWMAEMMEAFLVKRKVDSNELEQQKKAVKIWAHRGCSMAYPENTLEAFAAAAKLDGLAGIELDVQLTKDGELVVIHDEKVDRTTDGTGNVCDYTLEQLKALKIDAGNSKVTQIPTLEEVFDVMQDACKNKGVLINIELKNSNIRYEGMEEKVLALVEKCGLEKNIVYSSFLPESMGLIKKLKPDAETAILNRSLQQCIKKAKEMKADALHPWIGGLDISAEQKKAIGDMPVRAWNAEEPFFGQKRPLKEKDLRKYAAFGVTDIITNVPEMYL